MNRKLLAAVAVATFLAHPVSALGAAVAGVHLRPVIRLDGVELALASCGVRDTLWIDHYVAGLYVPRGLRAESAVRDPRASKVLVVQILNAEHFPVQLPEKWREPLRASLATEKFNQVSAAYRKLRDGDTMMYIYSPHTELAMTVNGETVVEAGHGVIDALLRAWQRGEDAGMLRRLLAGHDC